MRFPILAFLLLLCTCASAQKIEPQSADQKIIIGPNPSATNIRPLFVVDGEALEEGSINELDPNDIEAINVYKGEKAIASYGPAGANGVVAIVTKNGNYTRPSYTLTPDEIPADIFTRYAELNFAAGKDVVYLLDGKPQNLKNLRKLDAATIESIKVYKGAEKAKRLGQAGKDIVVLIALQ